MFVQTNSIRKKHTSTIPHESIFMFLFALSGAAGLIYEVVWVRKLILIFGASTHAVTIILTVFMIGLGIGAWFLGRFADQFNSNKLARYYIFLELCIGIYAILLPLILHLNEKLYIGFHQNYTSGHEVSNGIRILLIFMVFVIPTTLMGATLPVIARYLILSDKHISITVSRLYAMNTLGAVMGTVAAGYILLPNIGNNLTNLLAAAISIFVGFTFLFLHRSLKKIDPAESSIPVTIKTEAPKLSTLQRIVMLVFAISGAAAMTYEVAWTRALSMILGTTTYAFTTMLATFLLGIGIGSVLYTQIRKAASAVSLLVWLELIIAFSAILTIPLFSRLPFLYLTLYIKFISNWTSIQFIRFILAALVMIIPTIAMGCVFPVISEVLANKSDILGRILGKAYGFNTCGAAIGAAFAGLVLIPQVGMQKAIILGAFVNLLGGIVIFLFYVRISVRYRIGLVVIIASTFLTFIYVIQPWSPKVMSSGVYVYASRYRDLLNRVQNNDPAFDELKQINTWQLWDMAMRQYTLLFYKTGPTSTVSVMERNDGVRFLAVDGKTDASTGYDHDMKTQVLLGQLPLLFHPKPDSVFVVGLGSGVTVGSILTHPVRIVDCAEYSKSVVKAAEYFSEVNHNALEDNRLRIIPRDARNALMTYDKDYDVIISQPSNPWISGQSSLFSYEWYSIVHDHLADNGVFGQWVPAYHMSEQDVIIIIRTIRSVFPHVTAWTSGSLGELIFIAQKGDKLRISYDQFLKRVSNQNVQQDICRLGYKVETLPVWTFAMGEQDISAYLYSNREKSVRINTDDLLFTEFSTPKQILEESAVERFLRSDYLHGDSRSLMEIIENLDTDKLMQMLEAG